MSDALPRVTVGGLAVDDRGTLSFVNDFRFTAVRRFYLLENFSTDTIRAFHGHLKEEKSFFVVSGSAIAAAVKLDSVERPNPLTPVDRFVLSARRPVVLHIPAGYANGFRALEPDTRIIVFSSVPLEEAAADDYRYPADHWGAAVWSVENR